MVNKLTDGDYTVRGTGIVRLRGSAACFENALFRLRCRRGSFPFLPELGSRLWQLGAVRPADRQAAARQYCAQALQGTGVRADNVTVSEEGQALAVSLELCLGSDSVAAEVRI